MAKALVGANATEGDEKNLTAEILLAPEEILDDDVTNVRPWSSADDELEEIQQLAKGMRSVGQLNAVEVRVKATGDGTDASWWIVSGRRRRAAVMLINAELETGQDPWKVRCKVVELTDDEAVQHALIENAHRKDANAMDNAQNIANVRERKGWKGGKNTKLVAEYFGMSPAWVTTHEKLLTVEKPVQSMVSQGIMSADAAFTYVKVKPEDRPKVLEIAKDIQREETPLSSGMVDVAIGVADESEAGADPAVVAGSRKPGKKKRVTKKHVTEAIRRTAAQTDTPQPRTKKDLLDFFSRFDSVEYGFQNGAVRDFVQYLTEKYAVGLGTDRTLTEKFDRMVEKADRGTEVEADKKEAEPEKPKPSTQSKAAKKKAAKPATKKKATKKQTPKAKAKTKAKPKK